MKLVVAIIKSHRVEAVTEALDQLDVSGITLTDVRGHGRQRGHTEVYRGSEYKVDFLPKVRVDVLVKESEAEKVANVIVAEARTGQIGDGKLWIQPVDIAVRIRTGEIGEDARLAATARHPSEDPPTTEARAAHAPGLGRARQQHASFRFRSERRPVLVTPSTPLSNGAHGSWRP